MEPVSDSEVLKIMIDGGEKLCDYALAKWISNAYGTDNETRQESIMRWNEVRRRIRVVAKQFKSSGGENA